MRKSEKIHRIPKLCLKDIIIRILLTVILWPLAIVILVLKLRQSLTRYPKRLGLPGDIDVKVAVDGWLRMIDRKIPFGSSMWFVDRPKKPTELIPEESTAASKKIYADLNKKLKDEYGIG